MGKIRRFFRHVPAFLLLSMLFYALPQAASQPQGRGNCRDHESCPGGCRGCQGNCGRHQHGRGHAGSGSAPMQQGSGNPDHQADRELFHFLLDHGESVRRTVVPLEDGVETVTESDDPEVAGKIREHLRSMKKRLEDGRPIHMRDPLFAAIFEQADEIDLSIEETEKGVRVRETSSDPRAVALIKAHADVVSLFIKNGRLEARKDHAVPAVP